MITEQSMKKHRQIVLTALVQWLKQKNDALEARLRSSEQYLTEPQKRRLKRKIERIRK